MKTGTRSKKLWSDLIRLTKLEMKTVHAEKKKTKSGNPTIILIIVAALRKCDTIQSVQKKSVIIVDKFVSRDDKNG